jgi:hypothetical protein
MVANVVSPEGHHMELSVSYGPAGDLNGPFSRLSWRKKEREETAIK